jgi:hypothetical protein
MFGAPKNDIDFLKIFSWENILVKSSYYEKGQKRRKSKTPLFPQPHPRNNSFKKKNSFPLPIPLNKTPLFFKFAKTPHHFLKKRPYALLTQLLKKIADT